MSVSPQDVEKVALLARLTISESDLPEVTERFARVLGLVDELNTIDTQDVVPMSNPSRHGAEASPRCRDPQQRARSADGLCPSAGTGLLLGAEGH